MIRTPCHLRPFAVRSDAGVTLISVLVGLALSLLAIGLAASAYQQHVTARKIVAANSAAREVGSNITAAMMKAYVTYADRGCQGSVAQIPLGRVGALALTTSISVPRRSSAVMPPDFSQALERCSSVPQRQPGGGSATKLYGCYRFVPGSGAQALAASDAFLNTPAAFIEFTGVLQNFASLAPVTCTQAKTPTATFGLAGYYALHWVVNTVDGPVYKTKYGVTYSDLY